MHTHRYSLMKQSPNNVVIRPSVIHVIIALWACSFKFIISKNNQKLITTHYSCVHVTKVLLHFVVQFTFHESTLKPKQLLHNIHKLSITCLTTFSSMSSPHHSEEKFTKFSLSLFLVIWLTSVCRGLNGFPVHWTESIKTM